MASEDRDSFPDGFAIPLPPKPKKRKVITSDREICVICQADNPGEKDRNILLKKQKAKTCLKGFGSS